MTEFEDIETARYLAENGVPIFLAQPSPDFPRGGSDGRGYWIPKGWQTQVADPSVLDDWKPGMAVCAVMGHVVDGVDKDPRSGGHLPEELQPIVYGRQNTPSGGTHDLVATMGTRSKDGVLDGIDVKAGLAGEGHGFLFIAPTRRPSHSGSVGGYTWETRPDLDELTLIGGDDSGQPLAQLIAEAKRPSDNGGVSYDGPEYTNLSPGQKKMATDEQEEKLAMWDFLLTEAREWPEDYRDFKGRGWEALTRDFAWAVATTAVCPWMPMDESEAESIYHSILPVELAQDPKCKNKWYEGILGKAAARPVDQPPWTDFDAVDLSQVKEGGLPEHLDEAHMAEWLVEIGLAGAWCWTGGLGWMHWSGTVWSPRPEEEARDAVRRLLLATLMRAREIGADKNVIKKLDGYLTFSKIAALTTLMRGVVVVSSSMFDARPDLLNVANGVVNLATGELLEHSPHYHLTKITETRYVPGAKHKDWDQALKALDPEVVEWMQIRLGQAATGYPASDDVMPIGQGQGSNGKTTFITAVRNAMGDHAVTVPDKLLRAGPNDHPTELTSLLGARMAFIDETPEAAHLNVPRLKAVLGSEYITARKIHKDNITWRASHALFVMTNYVPIVKETDHGTWRRLALVKFDKTFPPNDAFRARMSRGQKGRAEATLAWIVEGAQSWYLADQILPAAPEKVTRDTAEWQRHSNVLMDYVEEHLVLDPGSSVIATELLDGFNDWLQDRSQRPWGEQLFISRFESLKSIRDAKIRRRRAYRDRPEGARIDTRTPAIPFRPTVWDGLRWRRDADPIIDQETSLAEFAEPLVDEALL